MSACIHRLCKGLIRMRICVTNRNLCSGDFFETVSKACQTADMVILREKDMSSTEYEKTAETVQKICKDNDTLFCINTFSDIAEKIKPDALQLSYNDFIKYTKKEILTGVSVHSLSEALSAEKYGADFLIAGHIFETDCKKGLAPANKVGVIDSDYRGEIMVALHNHTNETKEIETAIKANRLQRIFLHLMLTVKEKES